MYEEHQTFLRAVAGYDYGVSTCNRKQHEEWIEELKCPVLRLDGGDPLDNNVEIILEEYGKIIGDSNGKYSI